MGELEQAIFHSCMRDQEQEVDSPEEFPILGGVPPPTWMLTDQVMQWYLKVADID